MNHPLLKVKQTASLVESKAYQRAVQNHYYNEYNKPIITKRQASPYR